MNENGNITNVVLSLAKILLASLEGLERAGVIATLLQHCLKGLKPEGQFKKFKKKYCGKKYSIIFSFNLAENFDDSFNQDLLTSSDDFLFSQYLPV